MHMPNSRCNDLIEKTVAVLNQDNVELMLFAVQNDNLQFSVKEALNRLVCSSGQVEGGNQLTILTNVAVLTIVLSSRLKM